MKKNNAYVVNIEPDIEDLIPSFLADMKNNLAELQAAAQKNNYETIYQAAHKIKGASRLYGFEALSELAQTIEEAGKTKESKIIQAYLLKIKTYLEKVQIEINQK
jgi:HPt (histidine-containing phosphotransfer) domain-containing protein